MTTPLDPDVIYLADHSVLLAIPAFVPAFLVVGLVVFLAVRDRRAEAAENEEPRESGGEEGTTDGER